MKSAFQRVIYSAYLCKSASGNKNVYNFVFAYIDCESQYATIDCLWVIEFINKTKLTRTLECGKYRQVLK